MDVQGFRFSIPTLKSPTKAKRSYFDDCKSRFLLSILRCSPIKIFYEK